MSTSGIVAVGRRDGDTDADAHDHLMAVEIVGSSDDLDETRRQRSDIRRLFGWNLHDGKLVPAQSGHDVLAADATAHALGRRLQQQVPDRMSERIVDALEMVEIETENRDGFGAPQVAQDRFHPFIERHAVRQVGERIVVRQVLDSCPRREAVR